MTPRLRSPWCRPGLVGPRRLGAAVLACALAACSSSPFRPAPVQERSPVAAAREGTSAGASTVIPATPVTPVRPPAAGTAAGAVPPRGVPPPPPAGSALNGLMAPAPLGPAHPDDPVAVATPLRGDGSPASSARLAGNLPVTPGQPGAQPPSPRRAANAGAGVSGTPPSADVGSLPALDWSWPVDSPITGPYNDTRKGVDFTGALGSPVRAAAQGVVSYVGDSLRGYGRMVVLKHDKGYISVYAHNSEVLVKDGDKVVRGQKIALMGSSDSKDVVLHFELRHQGRPLDPLRILPGR